MKTKGHGVPVKKDRKLPTITTEIELNDDDVFIVVTGEVTTGGSNAHGSDEPGYYEVDIEEISAEDGRELSIDEQREILRRYEDTLWEKLYEAR